MSCAKEKFYVTLASAVALDGPSFLWCETMSPLAVAYIKNIERIIQWKWLVHFNAFSYGPERDLLKIECRMKARNEVVFKRYLSLFPPVILLLSSQTDKKPTRSGVKRKEKNGVRYLKPNTHKLWNQNKNQMTNQNILVPHKASLIRNFTGK